MKKCNKCGDPFEPKRIAGDHFTSWCKCCIADGLALLTMQNEPESDIDEWEKDQCHGEE